METPKFTVNYKCLFCGGGFYRPENVEYKSGDLIKCTKCGELNDYDSILDVAKEEGMVIIKEMVKDELQKKFKGLFKK